MFRKTYVMRRIIVMVMFVFTLGVSIQAKTSINVTEQQKLLEKNEHIV